MNGRWKTVVRKQIKCKMFLCNEWFIYLYCIFHRLRLWVYFVDNVVWNSIHRRIKCALRKTWDFKHLFIGIVFSFGVFECKGKHWSALHLIALQNAIESMNRFWFCGDRKSPVVLSIEILFNKIDGMQSTESDTPFIFTFAVG